MKKDALAELARKLDMSEPALTVVLDSIKNSLRDRKDTEAFILEEKEEQRKLLVAEKEHADKVAKTFDKDRPAVLTFVATVKESQIVWDWVKQHMKECPSFTVTEENGMAREYYVGAAGGGFSYIFTPSSIGTGITVKCGCGAKKDATDYEEW